MIQDDDNVGDADMVEYLIHREAIVDFPLQAAVAPLIVSVFNIMFSLNSKKQYEIEMHMFKLPTASPWGEYVTVF